jgi:predicted lipoprotein with Yx(FWY)xxD motif
VTRQQIGGGIDGASRGYLGGCCYCTPIDGNKQWAYKGHPLYTWKDDKKPGDITGDGFANGVWHIAQP